MNLFPISGALLAAGLAGLVAASVSDIKERLIYNEIVIFVLGVGLALRLVSTPELVWVSLVVAAVLLVVLGQLARFGVIGGGDAKLIAATLLLLPPQHDARLIAAIAVAGGILSCIYLAARMALRRGIFIPAGAGRKFPMGESSGVFANELAKITAGEPMPYALAILAGTTYSIASEAFQCISATFCSL
jgi:prepilin peptidase CpaA